MQFNTTVFSPNQSVLESVNAWKPKRKLDWTNIDESDLKTENIKRQTRAILNKLTPQNFSVLSSQMAQLDIDTKERVGDVMDIVFEKACFEPIYAEAYANLCKTVLSIRSVSTRFIFEQAHSDLIGLAIKGRLLTSHIHFLRITR